MNNYEAILFDFDGVLVDSEPVHFECWREILREYGFELEWPVYQANFIGVADRHMLLKVVEVVGPPLEFDELAAQYPRKKAMFRERVATADVMNEETRRMVASLEGYRLAVVSSSARTEVEPTLIRYGIRPFFEVLVCGWEAERLKPAPDPYLKAAALLAVRKALVVEDSDAGEQSGRAAGFDVLRVQSAAEVPRKLESYLAGNGRVSV